MLIWNARYTHRFAISRIQEVEANCGPEGDAETYSKIFMKGGDDAIVRTSDLDSIADSIVSVIPAPAGYKILHASLGEAGRGYVSRSVPVVGFAVTSNGETRPLTARGVHDGMFRAMPIEYPDGSIWDEASDCGYDNLGAYLLDWAAEQAARRLRNAEQAARQVPE